MSIGKICSRTTHTADARETVRVAADRMAEENVGTLIVVDADSKPVGILTDRDLAVRVLARALDPSVTTVGQVMTAHPRRVSERTSIEDAVAVMRSVAVRRLPVVDAGDRLVGIVSIDDVLELVTAELGDVGRILGWRRPGTTVPVTSPRRRKKLVAAGLERAASDLEC